MKEQIYTIPVTEAFRLECECPLCVLEKKFEDEYIAYVLGPFMMEPDGRIETNEKGFCRRHFEFLYNSQSNRHGLSLIIDTHLNQQNDAFKKAYENKIDQIKKDSDIPLLKSISKKISSKQNETEKFLDEVLLQLTNLEGKCTICSKLDYTMGRYIDVIFYLWVKEKEFKDLFSSKKGFCLKHLKQLLIGSKTYLNSRDLASFTIALFNMQINNMSRIQEEVNWFTKKFDYRNNDASWGNSKDAVPRSIQKISGYCDLK